MFGLSPAALVIVLLFLLLYFIPALVARGRSHHNAIAITVLNLFAGWTIVGWVVALVWASTRVQAEEQLQQAPVSAPPDPAAGPSSATVDRFALAQLTMGSSVLRDLTAAGAISRVHANDAGVYITVGKRFATMSPAERSDAIGKVGAALAGVRGAGCLVVYTENEIGLVGVWTQSGGLQTST